MNERRDKKSIERRKIDRRKGKAGVNKRHDDGDKEPRRIRWGKSET